MLDETTVAEEGVATKDFSIARKGYDSAEVDDHLAEIDVAFRELEEYAARLKQELAEAKVEIRRLERSEEQSIDNAMNAVFAAKERILERARHKALEIENAARIAAGLEPLVEEPAVVDDTDDDQDLIKIVTSSNAVASNPEPATEPVPIVVAEQRADGPDPAEVLRQMLAEADTIRSQLENGLTSAFDEIERMQRNAEARATELLDDARSEAALLRRAGETAGKTRPGPQDTKLEVTLTPGEENNGERRSRYSRNSAKLPRIGEDAGGSVLASMNQLRNKLREAEEVALKVQDPSAS